MKMIMRKNKVWLVYLAFILVLFLPLLKLGYIQTFDMPWGPHILQTSVSNDDWLLYHLLAVLSYMVSSMVVQKVLLVGLFVLAGVGAHRLALRSGLLKGQIGAAYVAGVLYMFNPFVYTRLMAGQWLVLCGYALLPWAIGSFWELMQRPSWRQLIRATGWTVAVGLTSIHAVGFVLVAHGVLFAAMGKRNFKQRTQFVLTASAAWLVLNAIWLIPLLLGRSHTASQIDGFGHSQLAAFSTRGTVAGSVPLTALLLEGFWADGQGRYTLPSHLGAWWWFVVVLLAAVVIYGGYVVVRKRDKLGISLLVLGAIAWWLGMGVGWHWSASTSNFLVAHLPFYRGYREPQKWLMLLAVLYSYLAAVGAARLLALVKKAEFRQPVLYGFMLLPILWTPILLWGAGGQLVSAQYPKDWATAEKTLDADKRNYQVLVLPWHQYLPLSFAKRVVANPANHYFKQQLIISDNPELRGVPPTEATPLYQLLDNQILPNRYSDINISNELAPYNVKYVLLLKEADWQQYGWLNNQQATIVQDTAHIRLYKLYTVQN